MHAETQANRLAQFMQKKGNFPSYELALPLVMVRSSDIKKMNTNDIFLLGLEYFECILIKDSSICAKVLLSLHNNRYSLKVKDNKNEKILSYSGKKYERLLFLFGSVKSRSLQIGHTIDISQHELEKIRVIHKNNKIADASLVSVEGELAIQIGKVKKDE